MDGGVASGFRNVKDSDNIELPFRLFHIRRENRITCSHQVPITLDSLNHGDTFVLDTDKVVYTWYGDNSSPFEKNKSSEIAHNMVASRYGKSYYVENVEDDNESFWSIFGGKGTIKQADEYIPTNAAVSHETRMYLITDENSFLKCKEIEVSRDNLDSEAACLVDTGKAVYIWVGKQANRREQETAMSIAYSHIRGTTRERSTSLVRVLDGREKRSRGFFKAFD